MDFKTREEVYQLMFEYEDEYYYVDAEGEEHDAICERCPAYNRCYKDDVYWECPHWEDKMGEEL